jgi:hypothetical protein
MQATTPEEIALNAGAVSHLGLFQNPLNAHPSIGPAEIPGHIDQQERELNSARGEHHINVIKALRIAGQFVAVPGMTEVELATDLPPNCSALDPSTKSVKDAARRHPARNSV